MRKSRIPAAKLLVFAAIIGLLALTRGGFSDPPAVPRVSGFAPAEDLLQQIDFFLGRVTESLADPSDFDLAKQARTLKDGNTLAVLGLVFSLSDEEHPLKASMPMLARAAQRLAVAGDSVEKANAAFGDIQRARGGAVEPGAAPKWEKFASLAPLMKQVPLIHAGLKRGVEPNRLARQAAQSAGQAASLAAIAQASLVDTEYAKTSADVDAWYACCAEMRDAAGAVNSAVRAKDAARVTAGMQRLSQSCETCHAVFRH